jgi:hypothetical protein
MLNAFSVDTYVILVYEYHRSISFKYLYKQEQFYSIADFGPLKFHFSEVTKVWSNFM